MKRIVKFSVACTAVYESQLTLPDDIDTEDTDAVLDYIRENLGDANIHELTWLNDWDPEEAVTECDIRSIEEVNY